MNTSLQSGSRAFGVAASFIGLLALIAAVLPQWVLPAVVPATPAGQIAAEKGHTLKGRIVAKLKSMTGEKQETKSEVAGLDDWSQHIAIAAISLALLAITLAVFSILRREEKLYAGVAAVLGASAVALQLTILLAGAAAAIIILYAVRDQLDGAIQPAVIAIGAVIVLLLIAVLGLGLVSSQLAGLAAGAAIVILIIYSILNEF